MSDGQNVRVSKDTHNSLVEHLKNDDRKLGKFVDIAIQEKIEKEKKKKRSRDDA